MMKRIYLLLCISLYANSVKSQVDSSLFVRTPVDTVVKTMNMDAVYNRPFLGVAKLPVALGGYMEANWQHLGTDGVSDGHQFQFRRLTLFTSASISRKVKFLSEIEFEDGTKEISIEFAALDIEFHPLLNLRGGMILNPIGAFNQNHDGPKWEFTDRPIASTRMLPATWSNAGLGLYGKYYSTDWMFGYEAYISGGFDGTIIDNEENRTFLPAAKQNKDRFEESSNGEPLYTAKAALRNNKFGEIGISYMGGVYNRYREDGIIIDEKRRLDIFAIDFNSTLPVLNTFITGEWAWISVEIPKNYSPQYGTRQHGGFVDIVQPVVKGRMLNWDKATISIALRVEYVDWNVGSFSGTELNIGNQLWSLMPGISFRPVTQTILRLNYRYLQETDLLNNLPATTGGFIFGISTYF